jgi:hypothetical protein
MELDAELIAALQQGASMRVVGNLLAEKADPNAKNKVSSHASPTKGTTHFIHIRSPIYCAVGIDVVDGRPR